MYIHAACTFYAVMIMVLAFYNSHFNTFRWHNFVHAIATAFTHKYILYDYSINDCALCVFLCICVKATTPPRCCTFILRTKHANRHNCRIARATSPKESHGACHTHSSITVRTMRDASRCMHAHNHCSHLLFTLLGRHRRRHYCTFRTHTQTMPHIYTRSSDCALAGALHVYGLKAHT